jgi:hypothetical protein
MKLRRKEFCHIHRSLYCCGREPIQRGSSVTPSWVQRIEDPHHPREYRELRSKAEMRKLLNRKIVEQNRQCAICQVTFTNYSDIVPDHIDPRGMGGRGETIIQKISRLSISGATVRKGSTREY